MKPRMNRLFARDGKCFDVAIDHGFFNEGSFLAGSGNISAAVDRIVHANPDAVQLTVGQAHWLQNVKGKQKPALVLRTDAGNFYNPRLPDYLFSQLMPDAVEQALALDAACVVVNLLLLPGQPKLYHDSVENVMKLKPACDRYGMPLMVEPLVMQPNDRNGGYMVDGDVEKIVPLVRLAVELGADLIKADPCDVTEQYHRVIEAASGKPVLVRGGGKASDAEILHRTRSLMLQGASGIVYGRNIVQNEFPERMTRALMAVVHEDASAEDAMKILTDTRP